MKTLGNFCIVVLWLLLGAGVAGSLLGGAWARAAGFLLACAPLTLVLGAGVLAFKSRNFKEILSILIILLSQIVAITLRLLSR